MSKKQIRVLLEKYHNGECTPEEEAFVHDWYSRLNRGKNPDLDETERKEMEQRIWLNMQEDLLEEGWKPRRNLSVYMRYLTGVAAVLLLIAGFRIYRSDTGKRIENLISVVIEKETRMMKEINDSDRLKKLILKDGSVITLTPGSSLSYPQEFADNIREVALEGDAFFEIAKNPDRPFFVKRGNLVTKVLGTSFWIKGNVKDNTLEVSVVTGKVSVFEDKEPMKNSFEKGLPLKSILLVPNEKVVYNVESGEIQHSVTEVQTRKTEIAFVTDMLMDNVQLPDILAVFKTLYGVEIELPQPEMARCNFTGDLSNMQFFDALTLLCKSVNATYESVGGRILISGKGCE